MKVGERRKSSPVPTQCVYEHTSEATSLTMNSISLKSQVAWVRHRDIHVLTVNTYTYTSDQRFQTAHHKDTDEWTLHIKWAQPRDAGKYECQVRSDDARNGSLTICGRRQSNSIGIVTIFLFDPFAQVSTQPVKSYIVSLNVVGK